MTFKRVINAVDTHSGIPMRVITGGVGYIPGASVQEKMRWLEANDDQLRQLMLREPRGYPAHCCNLLVPPSHPEADAGNIIMEQVEYPMMSGGNTISVVTVLLETGILPMQEPVTELTLEAPAGLIRIKADCSGGKVKAVTFRNVPPVLGRSRHLDRRHRPLPLRDRDLRHDGGPACQGRAAAGPGLPASWHPGHGLHRTAG